MGRSRQKPCQRCDIVKPVLYRVQLDASQQWQLVCRSCWEQVSLNNPFYRYGGTWKAEKAK